MVILFSYVPVLHKEWFGIWFTGGPGMGYGKYTREQHYYPGFTHTDNTDFPSLYSSLYVYVALPGSRSVQMGIFSGGMVNHKFVNRAEKRGVKFTPRLSYTFYIAPVSFFIYFNPIKPLIGGVYSGFTLCEGGSGPGYLLGGYGGIRTKVSIVLSSEYVDCWGGYPKFRELILNLRYAVVQNDFSLIYMSLIPEVYRYDNYYTSEQGYSVVFNAGIILHLSSDNLGKLLKPVRQSLRPVGHKKPEVIKDEGED